MSKRGSRLMYMPVRRRRKGRKKTNMFSKGTKRKFSDSTDVPANCHPEGPKMATYSLQRQSLLDMSLIKLQLCHMLVEPNLCRSVLIANTVRQIQEEMTHDGSWHVVTDAFSTSGQNAAEHLVASEVLCRTPAPEQDAGPKLFSVMGYDSCHEEEVVADEALSSVAGGERDTTCLLSAVGHSWERAELRAKGGPENGAGEDSGFGDEEEEEEEEEERTSGQEAKTATGQVFGKFEIKNNTPGSDTALEELFSDVDASYYDLDTMLTGMQSATPKMGPYDILDSLASAHGPASNSSCRPDLNELDHIMEIIVGS